MTWFRKEDESKIPEKLRGLKPEDVVASLDKAAALEADVAKLKTDLAAKDTEIANTTSEFNKTRERLSTLEANRGKQTVDTNTNKAPEFIEDPQGYVDARVNAAFNPLAQVALQTNAQLARESAKRTLDRLRVGSTKISKGAIFDKYSGEIDALAKTTNVQSLQAPDQWIHLFNMVLGQHMEEIIGAYSQGKGDELFVESGASSVQTNHDEPKSDKPTPREIEVAARMKIPIDQYMKNKKEMVFA